MENTFGKRNTILLHELDPPANLARPAKLTRSAPAPLCIADMWAPGDVAAHRSTSAFSVWARLIGGKSPNPRRPHAVAHPRALATEHPAAVVPRPIAPSHANRRRAATYAYCDIPALQKDG
jgi:hypothetical protein